MYIGEGLSETTPISMQQLPSYIYVRQQQIKRLEQN